MQGLGLRGKVGPEGFCKICLVPYPDHKSSAADMFIYHIEYSLTADGTSLPRQALRGYNALATEREKLPRCGRVRIELRRAGLPACGAIVPGSTQNEQLSQCSALGSESFWLG